MFESLAKPAAIAALFTSALGLAACGESSEEKATKSVCAATKEIQTQLKKLEALPISSSFPTEAKASVEAITGSVKKIEESASKLPAKSKEEINAANKAFQTEIAAIIKSVASATKSSNLETALKQAGPQIKASLSKVASDYKKAFEALKCS